MVLRHRAGDTLWDHRSGFDDYLERHTLGHSTKDPQSCLGTDEFHNQASDQCLWRWFFILAGFLGKLGGLDLGLAMATAFCLDIS